MTPTPDASVMSSNVPSLDCDKRLEDPGLAHIEIIKSIAIDVAH